MTSDDGKLDGWHVGKEKPSKVPTFQPSIREGQTFAGESLLLRIEARKSKTWNRDGAVHGFTLLRMKDRAKVPGWDLELQPGVQEFRLTAPSEPGRYEILCTVICSGDHEGMRMKFLVLP